jgi:hypothetical protein
MKSAHFVLVALMGLAPAAALAHGPNGHAADPNLHVGTEYDDCYVKFAPELTQSAFGDFAREFGSTAAYKQMSGPTTLGRRGVALGLGWISFTVDQYADKWNDSFAHPDAYHELGSDLAFPKLRLVVGVTDRIDLGAFWTRNPNANYGWLGLDMKYGLLQQNETTPVSLALRGAYTKTLYVEDMDMHALTADVTAGRTWSVLTPYLGVGTDLVYARERSDAVNLNDETQLVPRAFGGVELRYWHLGVAAEAEVGALNRLEVQVSARF